MHPAGSDRIWGLVAAGGAGTRFASERPKQYVELAGRPLLAHGIERLGSERRVAAVVVVVPRGDALWSVLRLRFGFEVLVAEGGEDRARSVANGLECLAARAAPRDFVLVHDAARPCLHRADLAALIDAGRRHPTGALLAAPVRDTLKREDPVDVAAVQATVERERLWRALTPQMFRLEDLASALAEARARGEAVTDDSQAMEGWAARRGRPPPRLVEGRPDNIKVTTPTDLTLVRGLLAAASKGRA